MAPRFDKFISTRAADEIPALQFHAVPADPVSMPHKVTRALGPMRIFFAILDRALGEFIIKNVYAAAVACQFDEAYMTAYFHADRPYKHDILSLNPHLFKRLQAAENGTLPIEFFYGYGDRAPIRYADAFIRKGLAFPDLMLTPSMVYSTEPFRFDYLPYLGVPTERQDGLDQELVDLGLDPNRWFCCIYYREPGYKYQGAVARRDVSAEPFRQLCEWIIKEQGGQVVRIGHPEMTPFGNMPGFVDLSRFEGKFLLQANAAARARFAVVTSSGPAALFGAFGVPHAVTNAIGISTSWRETDFAVPRHFRGPDGKMFDIAESVREGSWNERTVNSMIDQGGYSTIDNSPAELQAAAEMLFRETQDMPGWRPHRDVLADAARYTARPNQHITNGPMRRSARIVQFTELAPKDQA